MRAVIQRVSKASVSIEGSIVADISSGLLILLGICHDDNELDVEWLVRKITNMRIFQDDEGKLNISLKQSNGEVIVVSQFTLFASCKKGNRPSFTKSAPPELAEPLYEKFIEQLDQENGKACQTGEFGADMQVSLLNDGPVTIIIDSKTKE